ncbi:ZIP family metal transporter [Halegenticoccus soli]|uniref:ZIP family metal transporter n=1 Tax=Halegenticoccus soli TaxID=1985678 RepID=UPI000C6E6C7A|nr:ZIP family metal transporter [Halegenticoccus soli]
MATLTDVLVVSLLAGGATGIGALPLFATTRISHRIYDGALGLAAGIMFGAAVFALILPGLELGSLSEVIAGVFVGGGFLLAVNRLVPHLHEEVGAERPHGPVGDGSTETPLRRALLIGGAITIHNVPEGLAVGIAFASGLEGVGLAVALAIAIQNVPDGFAMAVPAVQAGVPRAKTLLYTTASGGVPEPLAALVGFLLVELVTGVFPFAAGVAAGAMMAVIFREVIPSSHGHGYADLSTLTFVSGFVTMMVVDTVFAV